MYVSYLRSYIDISSISQRLLTIKQHGGKHFSKILHIYIPTLAKRIMSQALKFQFSKLHYIHQVLYFISMLKLI